MWNCEESRVRVGEEDDLFRAIWGSRARYKIWWLLIFVDGETGEMRYVSTLSSAPTWLRQLHSLVSSLKREGARLLLFAVWHGSHRTDAFHVDPDRFLKEVEEHVLEEQGA